MAPPPAIRPENIIKTCEHLVKINNSDEALDILKEFISSRKFKYVSAPAAESIGLLFVQLCVVKKDSKLAKEGLFSYKKNAQTITNGLETVGSVVKRYVQLAEASLEKAKAKAADAKSEETIGNLDDEDDKSPEALLLSIVSDDNHNDRSDRELLTPYLKFMYDVYKSSLDIIRNIKQLEVIYCTIVNHSFKFCESFQRKLEFKKFSELIRIHLQSINFYANNQSHNSINALNQIDLNNPATLERFLQLRFNGLNIAVQLELYQESFKIVEDIHTLLVLSKRQAKPSMMLNYYENLAKIFNVSVNTLYRSVAWLKFFNLYSQSQNATLENLKNYASIIVLSTLSISESFSEGYNENNDEEKNKFNRLSSLLNLAKPPTRNSMISAINNPNFMKFVDDDLKSVFNYLENDDFNPLFIQSELVPILSRIYETGRFKVFFNDLLNTILVKIFKQVSKSYSNIKYDYLIELATFKDTKFALSSVAVENLLITCGKNQLIGNFSIDHDANIIYFNNNPFTSGNDSIKQQLSQLSNTLLRSLYNTDSSLIEKQEAQRSKAIETANKEIAKEIEEMEKRRELLEKRKAEEAAEEAKRAEEAKKLREEKIANEKKAEKERQEQEAQRRLEEDQAKEREEIRMKEKIKVAEEINKAGILDIDMTELKNMEIDDLKKLQIEKLTEDQRDTQERLKALFKRNDHLERALRKYELKFLEEDRKVQKEKDLEEFGKMKARLIEKANKEHEESIKLRDRLKRIVPSYESYRNKIDATHAEQIKKLKAEASAKLEKEKQERIQQLKEAKLQQMIRERAEEAERQRKAEEDAKIQAKLEQEEKKKLEAAEKLKSEMAAQRQKDADLLAKQRDREAEIEKMLAEKNKSFSSGEKYRVNRSASGGSFRPESRSGSAGGARSFSGSASSSPKPEEPATDKPLTYAERMRLKRQGRL
ncbi:translation initiation factor eIF3 core subunit A [Saccharomycopsis crataegensis]|uniref:Translation initiation factor eIF3 core subunit A n=1 Tax=Saccharomycopsis crataegensis TaxID=43959 RepID=A0AAV5QSH3_9ASCO|nr:translation initiation factor eIF3 core subunit A [Saccharomycopsis crataegensis]